MEVEKVEEEIYEKKEDGGRRRADGEGVREGRGRKGGISE